jgi:hypothetical protein
MHVPAEFVQPATSACSTNCRIVLPYFQAAPLFFFQWLLQPIQDPGLLFNSVIIFHRRQDSLDEGSACRKAAT